MKIQIAMTRVNLRSKTILLTWIGWLVDEHGMHCRYVLSYKRLNELQDLPQCINSINSGIKFTFVLLRERVTGDFILPSYPCSIRTALCQTQFFPEQAFGLQISMHSRKEDYFITVTDLVNVQLGKPFRNYSMELGFAMATS